MRKLLSAILIIGLLLSLGAMPANAQTVQPRIEANPSRMLPNMKTAEGQRLRAVFNEKIAELQAVALADLAIEAANSRIAAPVSFDLTIDRIAELRDFAGNLFTLVEMKPFGYMIYHNDSGNFVERSAGAPSPYAGFSGGLFYGGFSEYLYQNKDGDYVHTLSGRVTDAAVAQTSDWAGHCNEVVAAPLLAEPDFAVLNYVEQGAVPVTTNTVSADGFTNVNDYTFIQNQTSVTNTDGRCTYVALAILIGYFDHVSANRNMGILNSTWVTSRHTNSAKVQNSFVNHLISIGQGFGYGKAIWLSEAQNVAKQFFTNRGVWNKIEDKFDGTTLLVTNSKIKSNINNNRPVVLCAIGMPGRDGPIGNHSVVAYGYRTEFLLNVTYRVNYGWGAGGNINGRPYNDVWVNGPSFDQSLTYVVTP